MRFPGSIVRYTASGSLAKPVDCENCHASYEYDVFGKVDSKELAFLWLGVDAARERARSDAPRLLRDRLARSIKAVPCPRCGWYQAKMVEKSKERLVPIPISLAAIAAASIVYFWRDPASFFSVPALTTAAVVFGVGLAASGLLGFFYNPNSGHPGKGEQLSSRAAKSTGRLSNPTTDGDEVAAS